MFTRKIVMAAMGLVIAAGAATTASAETSWERHHQRRDEVNDRLDRQNHRIHEERKLGLISARRAHYLHAEDHYVRMQERHFARHHHGHISRHEQRRLNHEENRVNRHIG
jgi:hypothetical protein